MSRCCAPVIMGDRSTVAVHLRLPEKDYFSLGESARATRIPRSDLLLKFLEDEWDEFRRDYLMEGLVFLLGEVAPVGSLPPLPADVPEWVSGLLERRRAGERSKVFTAFVPAAWWKRLAGDLRDAEREFVTITLDDVMALFFAARWGDFADRLKRIDGPS